MAQRHNHRKLRYLLGCLRRVLGVTCADLSASFEDSSRTTAGSLGQNTVVDW